jgi:hypothetical protein
MRVVGCAVVCCSVLGCTSTSATSTGPADASPFGTVTSCGISGFPVEPNGCVDPAVALPSDVCETRLDPPLQGVDYICASAPDGGAYFVEYAGSNTYQGQGWSFLVPDAGAFPAAALAACQKVQEPSSDISPGCPDAGAGSPSDAAVE